MSQPNLTSILEDLAAGRITSAEAASRIDGLNAASGDAAAATSGAAADDYAHGRPQHAGHARESFLDPDPAPESDAAATQDSVSNASGTDEPASAPQAGAVTAPPRGAVNGVERISIRAVGRRVRVLGDPKVSTATVEGPHVLRRNGAVMEISSDGDVGPSLDGFSMLRPPRNLDDFRSLGLGKELLIKVNPRLTVDAEVTAGSLRTEKVPYLGKIRVTAGGAKATGVAEVADALVQAGQGTFEGTVVSGRSRVRAESGSLTVRLDDNSNVTVKSEAQLGRVSWAGGHSGAGDEVVMGNGNARLDVGVVMGHAQVRVGSETNGDGGDSA